ncbi:oxidoreductase [Denitratisoma sp. DHT3]|uniref:SDR family NAD(P)-dependent oxidoreductase n=1 Tax=Denitratisoma sp. DHT3 TaxID=1981880 RepID=UPI0011985BFC|nr:SDR family oxidoreductase [Denitratisoma sp. DHT3]QDX80763.1 oxidoreductase [Denitratisoma sp. DHT3]
MTATNGKVAIVAGGGGIGGATARKLAEVGTAVVIGDISEANAQAIAQGITAQGGQARAIRCDISDEASVAAMVRLAVESFGGLDLIHVNAADLSVIFRDSNAVDVDLAVFDQTIAVNLRGHLLCTRAAIPEMLKRGGGAIVYTTSGAAFIGEEERPCYAMAKAGLNALMRHVASRWGRHGIRANCVAPGFVITENNLKTLPEGFADAAVKRTRSTRLGQPEDIAAMVALLFSEEGMWINGQVISVDGGATMR